MLKVIIVFLIVGAILYMVFGIWGIIIPAVLFVGVVIAAIINANKNPAVAVSESKISESNFSFDTEMDVGSIPINIKYRNNDGNNSERNVDVHKIGISGKNLYIRGLCHLTNEERTFKAERIIEATINGKSVNPMVFVIELCKDREEFDKGILNGVNFCLTGKLKIMTRNQARERIEAYGGGFHERIKYNTHFLVAENSSWNTGKLVEARAHGITIIDEDTFIDYLTEPAKAQAAKREIKGQYEYYKESVENDLDHKKAPEGFSKNKFPA